MCRRAVAEVKPPPARRSMRSVAALLGGMTAAAAAFLRFLEGAGHTNSVEIRALKKMLVSDETSKTNVNITLSIRSCITGD